MAESARGRLAVNNAQGHIVLRKVDINRKRVARVQKEMKLEGGRDFGIVIGAWRAKQKHDWKAAKLPGS